MDNNTKYLLFAVVVVVHVACLNVSVRDSGNLLLDQMSLCIVNLVLVERCSHPWAAEDKEKVDRRRRSEGASKMAPYPLFSALLLARVHRCSGQK